MLFQNYRSAGRLEPTGNERVKINPTRTCLQHRRHRRLILLAYGKMESIFAAFCIYNQASLIHLENLNSPALAPELIHRIVNRESDQIPNTANRILS